MEFIKYKMIARSVCASIMPILIYSSAFGIYKITGDLDMWQYNNLYCWMAIMVSSLVYPINQVGLFLLFKPLDVYLKSKLKSEVKAAGKNTKPNPILTGNFGPIKNEQSYEVTNIVEGNVPKDISGVYLRNGPNPVYFPDSK